MKLFLRTSLFLTVASFAPHGFAQTTPTQYYVGGSTNDFDNVSAWGQTLPGVSGAFALNGTAAVPGANDIALIDADRNGNTVTLTVTVQSHNVAGLQFANFLPNSTTTNLPISSGLALVVTGRAGDTGTQTAPFGDFVVEAGNTLNYSGAGSTLAVNRGLIVIGDNTNNGNFSDFSGTGVFNIQSGSFNTDPASGPAGSTTEWDIGAGSGSTGTVTQGVGGASSSSVTVGNTLYIGYGGGSGTYTLFNSSVLQTGSTGTVIVLGFNVPASAGGNGFGATVGATGGASTGILNIDDTSAVVIGTGSDLQLGGSTGGIGVTAGSGTVNQNGGSLTLNGTATIEVGAAAGARANTYNLNAGTLSVGTAAGDSAVISLGNVVGSNGTLNQTGGVFIVGDSNPADANTSTFNVGVNGTGTYTMTGGTSVFYNGLTIGATGAVKINGGVLTVADNLITGPGGLNTGNVTLGGGTLKLTAGAGVTAYTYNFGSNLTGGTSTIDVSAAGLNTFTFANALTSSGLTKSGINLIGNNVVGAGTTVFNFASAAGGGAGPTNTYTGNTGISGGTLNAVGGDFAGATAGTTLSFGTNATAASTILNLTLSTATTTLPQSIVGSGQLNAIFTAANETLVLSNTTNALSTVNITVGAGPGGVGAGTQGTLQLLGGTFGAISDNGTASNVVIGNGTSTGAVVLTGANTYTGATTVNTGAALSALNLDGALVNSGTVSVTNNVGLLVTDNVTNNAGASLAAGSISGNVLSNAGAINVGAAGIGGNVNNAGTLVDVGAIGGNVINTGSLTATSALSMNNTGFIRTTTPISTFAITNNFTQGAGGSFLVNVAGATSDVYTATTANLTGIVQVQGASLSTTVPTLYNIVQTTGGVTDVGLTTQNSFLLSTSLAVVGNNLVLSVTTNPFVGSTPNQQALATVLNANPNNPITVAVTNNPTLTQADEAGILQSLIPENLQFARFINIENVNYMVQRIGGVDADLRNGISGLDTSAVSVTMPGFQSGMGRSLHSLAYNDPGFHQAAPNGVNYYPGEAGRSSPSPSAISDSSTPATFDSSSQVISDSPNPYLADVKPGTSETPRLNEFIGGDVILADLNQNPSANANSKASYTAGDVTAGVSYRVTNHFAAGVLFDYNHTDADIDSNGGKTKIDSYTPGIFATYFDHGFYANGLFAVGLNEYKNTQNTFLGQTTGKPSGQQYTGNLDAGYDFHPTKNWIVGPTAGLTYTHVDIDSFTEDGAPGAALNVDSQSVDSLRSRLGGHVVFQTNTGDVLLQPNLTLAWQHEFLNDADSITSSFANTSLNPFTIQTAAPSRDSALIGLGMTATLNNSMALYLNYLADVGASNYFSQSVYGGIKARF